MYWPDEDLATVLYISSMVDPFLLLGKPCTMRIGSGRSYRGVTAGIGVLHTSIIIRIFYILMFTINYGTTHTIIV